MKRAIGSVAALCLAFGILAVPASAETIAPTTLSLRVSDKTPEFRSDVIFTGTLKSSRRTCIANRPVKLFRNGEPLRSAKTNGDGIVKWNITIRANGKWQLRYASRLVGQHPNEILCEASRSRIVRVRVQNKP